MRDNKATFVQLSKTTQTLINLDLKLPYGLKLQRALGGVQGQYAVQGRKKRGESN